MIAEVRSFVLTSFSNADSAGDERPVILRVLRVLRVSKLFLPAIRPMMMKRRRNSFGKRITREREVVTERGGVSVAASAVVFRRAPASADGDELEGSETFLFQIVGRITQKAGLKAAFLQLWADLAAEAADGPLPFRRGVTFAF